MSQKHDRPQEARHRTHEPVRKQEHRTTRLGLVLLISVGFFIAEIAIGFKTRSLALIADAFHYFNDICAYAIAAVAAYLQEKRPRQSDTLAYGYARASLLGSFFNGSLLLALGLSTFLQSLERFINPQDVESGELVMIVGAIGLALNLTSAAILGGGHGHDHGKKQEQSEIELEVVEPERMQAYNIRHRDHHHMQRGAQTQSHRDLGIVGVLVHLAGDAINNVGVIIAGALIWKLDSPTRFYADPAVSTAISLFIFTSALPLAYRSGMLLLEATPKDVNIEHIKADLKSVPGVADVSHVHIWHLSQDTILATLDAHVTSLESWARIKEEMQSCLRAYGCKHATISAELITEPSVPATACETGK